MLALILSEVQIEGVDTNVNRDVACKLGDTSMVDSMGQGITRTI